MHRFLIQYLLVFIILGSIALVGHSIGKEYLNTWALKEQVLPEAQEFRLELGQGLQGLANKLEAEGLVSNSLAFQIWARLTQPYRKYQAGLYRFEKNISPQQISQILREGKIYTPIALQFTIPEGFTQDKIFRRLSSLGVAPVEKLYELSRNVEFLKELAVPSSDLEGFLYPATYRFSVFPSPKDTLASLVRSFFDKLPKDYAARLSEQQLSLRDAVIVASLIEAETMVDAERPMVSEVIWRRLRNKMALAIDASIIYGIPNYDGNLRATDLKNKDNLYNTRVHGGLPPGPICSPALASLEAVLAPSNNGYLYYVLLGDASGRHVFSKTLDEHNARVREFLKLSRARRIEKEKQAAL